MLKRIKQLITSLMATGLIVLPLGFVSVAHAVTNNAPSLCQGASLTVGTTSATPCDNTGAGSSLNNIVRFALNLFSVIVGIIAVVMIVVGGLKYVTSGGDSQRVSGAKDTILFAVVGLIVVALAQVIVHFVLQKVQANS